MSCAKPQVDAAEFRYPKCVGLLTVNIVWGGGGGREDIIDVLLKIWLSVPNVLARIVPKSRFNSIVPG